MREAKKMCDLIFLQCKNRFNCTCASHLDASKLLQLINASYFVRAGHYLMTLPARWCSG